jgi:hypothetical protein
MHFQKVIGVLKMMAMESSCINVAPLPGAPTASVTHMMFLVRTTSFIATRWYVWKHINIVQGLYRFDPL